MACTCFPSFCEKAQTLVIGHGQRLAICSTIDADLLISMDKPNLLPMIADLRPVELFFFSYPAVGQN